MPLSGFLPGPKDMLDAVVAALTGKEFPAGRGQEIGGGDGWAPLCCRGQLPNRLPRYRTGPVLKGITYQLLDAVPTTEAARIAAPYPDIRIMYIMLNIKF